MLESQTSNWRASAGWHAKHWSAVRYSVWDSPELLSTPVMFGNMHVLQVWLPDAFRFFPHWSDIINPTRLSCGIPLNHSVSLMKHAILSLVFDPHLTSDFQPLNRLQLVSSFAFIWSTVLQQVTKKSGQLTQGFCRSYEGTFKTKQIKCNTIRRYVL